MKRQSLATSGNPHFEVKDSRITIESISRVREYWRKLGLMDSVKWLDATMEKAGFDLTVNIDLQGDSNG